MTTLNEYVYKYINSDDIDDSTIELLENTKLFMEKVILITNDYKMYYYCSDKVKTDPGFVRFLMKKFTNNLDFLCEVANYYLKNGKNDKYTLEIAILMKAILKGNNDSRFYDYQIMADIMYTSLRLQVESAKNMEKDDYEFQYNTGLGFWYIFDMHKNNELVTDFYAKKMINEVFLDDYYSLDKVLHNQYSSVEEIENKDIYNVLINAISIYDNMLAAYVAVHKNLLKGMLNKLSSVIKRWDKYVDLEEIKKYDAISEKVSELMEANYDYTVLSEKELLSYTGKQFGIIDKMIRYRLIDDVDVELVEEDEANIIATLNNSLLDRSNYKEIKNIIKSILFDSQNKIEEKHKEGKILCLDDYRNKGSKEKTGQK